jgi:hypothetical protein
MSPPNKRFDPVTGSAQSLTDKMTMISYGSEIDSTAINNQSSLVPAEAQRTDPRPYSRTTTRLSGTNSSVFGWMLRFTPKDFYLDVR